LIFFGDLVLALLVLALIFEIAAVGFGLLLIKGTNEVKKKVLIFTLYSYSFEIE